MLDWLIIGGGLHGSHIARRLMATRPDADIAVLDPAAHALTHWQRRADACGMAFLRSSQAHHLGLRSDALRVFAREHGYDGGHSLGRYRRPSRALFEAHVRSMAAPVPRLRARADIIERHVRGWRVHTVSGGHHDARQVIMAQGPTAPGRPDWGRSLPHVLDADFAARHAGWTPHGHVVVVGGGLSAAQRAIACAADGHGVTLLTRRPLRQAAFDSDPCFSGPRCLTPFLSQPVAERPALLAAARNPGTLPGDIYAQLASHIASGTIRWLRGAVRQLQDDGLELHDQRRVRADHIILATGFSPGADALLSDTAERLHLPLDAHGHAHVDTSLCWADGLHVAGRPASLQLGPMAGNIRGAQLAARRLAEAASTQAVSPASAALP